MLETERAQLRTDFGRTPELVDKYVAHTPREDALRAARQVTGAGTYLSWMLFGEPRMEENAIYAVTIVCLDELTDEVGVDFSGERINKAIAGNPTHESLEIVPACLEHARGPRIADALRKIAAWQDSSREQEGDINAGRAEVITREKGGWSALGHVHMMGEDPTAEDDDFAHRFGFLMQLLDDYLDKPEDEAEGITTCFTRGMWTVDMLDTFLSETERVARERYGDTTAVNRFFNICRLHRKIAWVRNNTRFDPTRLVPWYL